jgi:uncharacterized repeat protein (TIGR01451 family)
MVNKLKRVILVLLILVASTCCSNAQYINISDENTSFESNITENYSNNSINTQQGVFAHENAVSGNNVNDDFNNPVNFDYLKNVLIFPADESENLPSYYDLRLLGRVTPVKDQDTLGTCWDFATMGSLESSLLPGESWNFSENNVKNILSYSYPEGFDRTYQGGADWLAALAYYVRYSGPVLASLDPYNQTSDISPSGLLPAVHVQESVFIPPRNNSLDNAQCKLAIMKYGAVVSQMFVADDFYSFYNRTTYSYYYNGSGIYNHDICLVGWDDDYDKNNFLIKPQGNGAFIVRNSWGTGFGDGGYFYISYYDTVLATKGSCAFTNTESASNYNQVYQYDPYGVVNMTGFKCSTAWFSNVFTANTTNPLVATSFYALTPNSTYDISVYLNPSSGNPTSGTIAYTTSGMINTPGYKTIRFANFIPMTLGEVFSVAVKITSPGLTRPVAYEYPLVNYSSRANASLGEGFISSDGTNWLDMAGVVTNASVCLKAFTVSAGGLVISQESDNNNPQLGDIIQLTIKIFNQGPDQAFNITVNDKLPAGLSILSYLANYGAYDPVSGVWNVGDLAVGATAILIIKSLASQLGSLINMVTVNSLTYNPLTNLSTLSLDIKDTNGDSPGIVKAASIPLRNTGSPLFPLIATLVLILGGFITSSRRGK